MNTQEGYEQREADTPDSTIATYTDGVRVQRYTEPGLRVDFSLDRWPRYAVEGLHEDLTIAIILGDGTALSVKDGAIFSLGPVSELLATPDESINPQMVVPPAYEKGRITIGEPWTDLPEIYSATPVSKVSCTYQGGAFATQSFDGPYTQSPMGKIEEILRDVTVYDEGELEAGADY